MRSRLLLFRRAAARKLQRTFAQSAAVRSDLRYRPQIPFLSVPTTTAGRVRYMTTERKAQLKYEIKTGIKYVGYIWIAGICVVAAWGAIGQELLERRYPTPHEWGYATRFYFRGGHTARYEPPPGRITDWLQVGWWIERTIKKLEDPNIDGQGVKDAPPDSPPGTKDVTAKSENWRRGYYEAMMFYAKAAEYMDGWVLDKSRNIVFPPGVMIGPSNPYPKPLPPGYKGAPKEEDCELRFESPDAIYLRILSTVGFTNRQRIDAGLAYASWLDYKGVSGPASIIYEDAVHLAASERPDLPSEPLDKKAWTLNDSAGPPSENLLNALTAYATFRARQGDASAALPILVSILKARRSLLPPPEAQSLTSTLKSQGQRGTFSFLASIFTPPPYPAPPADGTSPPVRDAKELCQEAALNLHIGEIMPSTSLRSSSTNSPLPGGAREHSEARATCRECLSTGLGNWATMVARLAREEEEKAAAAKRALEERGGKGKGWFGSLWDEGVAKAEDTSLPNRWAAEAKVIEERQRRVRDVLEDLKPLPRGWQSWITA
ncbi:hypothetical protein MMYC01_207297 [Madurella mycetomatis]|uniref:MFS maltose permease n=1 Tax=Madurella mycetomatis TaxID=100816 RepID=A0A175VXW5_9PEZI|nr:hypothetical protein MMYC01_207297 [Madurella mycetomatis]